MLMFLSGFISFPSLQLFVLRRAGADEIAQEMKRVELNMIGNMKFFICNLADLYKTLMLLLLFFFFCNYHQVPIRQFYKLYF